MADLFASGRLIDGILILIVLEVLAIFLYRRSTGRGVAMPDLLPNIFAGAFLLLALRASLSGGGWMPVSVCLACAGVAHVIDLGRRLRRRP